MSPVGLRTKNQYIGEGQQQFSSQSQGLIGFMKAVVVLRIKRYVLYIGEMPCYEMLMK
jgi:hypothetical protein